MANVLKAMIIVGAAYTLAFATNVPLVFRLAYAITAIVIICFFWSRMCASGLDLRRHPGDSRVQVGHSIKEVLFLKNRSLLPNLYSELVDHSSLQGHRVGRAFAVRSRGAARWEIDSICQERGKFVVGPCSITIADPFGVFRWRKFFADTWALTVYPRTYDLPNFRLSKGDLSGGRSTRQRTFFATPSAGGVREYFPGDGFNRIHWPSSARMQRLMTKEFELDPASDIWIALDLQGQVQSGHGQESTTEYSISIVASLAKHLIDENRSVGVISFGAYRMVVHGDRGERHLFRILEEMATARAEGERPLAEVLAAEGARFGPNTTLIVISPSTNDAWVRAVEQSAARGVKAIAIHLQASTFGQAPNSSIVLGALVAAGLPALVVKKGDAIGDVLCLSS